MYYYQIQTQLFVCDVEHCDFCVCTFADSGGESAMHIECIHKNCQFWTNCVETAKTYFRTCLLPELMGSWFTRPLVPSEGHSAKATDVTDTAVHQASDSQHTSSSPQDVSDECQPSPPT